MTTGPVSPTPFGRTREFVERVKAHRGDAWAASYLNRQNCIFADTKIFTTHHGREQLLDQSRNIAKACGVEIVVGARFNPNPGSDAILTVGA